MSPSKPSDEVVSPAVNHQLEATDSRSDPTVPVSVMSSESASRPQTSNRDEQYEHSQPERLYYDAMPPRPPLPSQPPSGMSSG